MIIRVLSFDFDGCLFHTDYLNSQDKNIITHNQDFLDAIKTDNLSYGKVYTFIGSNRQSYRIDADNSFSKDSGSCFQKIKDVNSYLDTTFDPFLLADIYGDLDDGTSYHKALSHPKVQSPHADWVFDLSKVTILYAQMHKIANLHPDEEIDYDFYDDRGDILSTLHIFYTNHPDLIPSNVSFQTHLYNGETQVADRSTIQGKGMIDTNYRQTIKDMATQVIEEPGDSIHVANFLQAALLQHRKPLLAQATAKEGMGFAKRYNRINLLETTDISAPTKPTASFSLFHTRSFKHRAGLCAVGGIIGASLLLVFFSAGMLDAAQYFAVIGICLLLIAAISQMNNSTSKMISANV